jgi:hypothetical protein
MRPVIVLLIVGLAGCATSQRPVGVTGPSSAPAQSQSNLDRATVARVTRYELGDYRYPRHGVANENSVVRTTRMPANTRVRESEVNVSPSYDPLPPSAELTAELSAQREITRQIREMKSVIAAAEQNAKEQYGALVEHTAAVIKLRQQLEVERARLRELEFQLKEQRPTPAAPVIASSPASTSTEGVKW